MRIQPMSSKVYTYSKDALNFGTKKEVSPERFIQLFPAGKLLSTTTIYCSIKVGRKILLNFHFPLHSYTKNKCVIFLFNMK